MQAVRIIQFALLVLCLSGALAGAHEVRPAFVTPSFASDGRYTIAILVNMEALLAGVRPDHGDADEAALAAQYDGLRVLSAAALRARFEIFAPRWLDGIIVEFDGKRARPRIASIEVPDPGDLSLERLSTVRLTGEIPDGAINFRWAYAREFGHSLLRIEAAGAGGDAATALWLRDGAMSEPIAFATVHASGALATFAAYLRLGFTHILPDGADHILFVLGLTLLTTQLRPLLVQVTAFTIAHSITLTLGLYGLVRISPSIVEPLIAASIAFVAIENLMTRRLTPWRPFVVFGFGLIHGLGFAGVLREIGLPRADYAIGLTAFNIGVELGQLAVIAIAFAATGLWFRSRPWYRARIVWPASAAIAAVGLFWTAERVFAG